ncbi:MAG: response regulator transcription factor [Dehalococcoidia bacterium]
MNDDGHGYNWWGETVPPAPEDGGIEQLTGREREVLRLLAEGRSSKEIARELVLSVRTIEWHVHNLHRKACTRGRRQLRAYARRLSASEQQTTGEGQPCEDIKNP